MEFLKREKPEGLFHHNSLPLFCFSPVYDGRTCIDVMIVVPHVMEAINAVKACRQLVIDVLASRTQLPSVLHLLISSYTI
jgi:hypothetical protein